MNDTEVQKLVAILEMYLEWYKKWCSDWEQDYVWAGFVDWAQSIIDIVRAFYWLD